MAHANAVDVEGLGDDREVCVLRSNAADLAEVGHPRIAAAFLVDGAADLDGSAGLDTRALQGFGREESGRDARLHVAGAAAVDAAVRDLGAEGILRPAATRGDHIEVAVHVQRLAGTGTLTAADHVDAGMLRGVLGHALGCDVLGRKARAIEPAADATRALLIELPRRVDRGDADHLAGELDRFVDQLFRGADDALVLGCDLMGIHELLVLQ